MPTRFLPAGPADTESLLIMMKELQEDDPWEERFNEARLRLDLTTLLENPVYGLALIAWEESKPVGYLVICFDYSLEYRGKGAWVDELFVRAASRNHGIGSRLLDLADSVSREHGAQVLHLEVNHGNRAIELYRRRGFQDHHRYLMTKHLKG